MAQRAVKKRNVEDKSVLEQIRIKRKHLAKTLILATNMFESVGLESISDRESLPDSIDFACFCPHCKKPQTDDEVLNGASESPYDITTECSSCNKRYATTLSIIVSSQITRVPWLCPQQTIDQYKHWLGDDKNCFESLFQERPDIYWNAIKYAIEFEGSPLENIDDALHTFLNKD